MLQASAVATMPRSPDQSRGMYMHLIRTCSPQLHVQLVLQQNTPITDRKYNGIYDAPILSSNSSAFVQAVQVCHTMQLCHGAALYSTLDPSSCD
jgi:hypothetical protein